LTSKLLKPGKSCLLKELTQFLSEHIFFNAEIFLQLMTMEVQILMSSCGISLEKIKRQE
jgi:hypothetical protein